MSYLNPPGQTILLGVNIDHIATLRNVRGTAYPDLLQASLQAEEAGADVITLHLREDRRHITDADVKMIRPCLMTRMNLEVAVTQEMLDFACHIRPQDICLVPERREELTTEGGLDVVRDFECIRAAVQQCQGESIRVSLFIDPVTEQIHAAQATGATVIELHTGRYAREQTEVAQQLELAKLQRAIQIARQQGLQVNAGHGLHYYNTPTIAAIPEIVELNIGHAIVAHAVFVGWRRAVSQMKALMHQARLT